MDITALNGPGLSSSKVRGRSGKKGARPTQAHQVEGLAVNGLRHGLHAVEQAALGRLKAVVNDAAKHLNVSDLSTLDTSPEATARRIADFAIGMYSIYKQQNPHMEEAERLEKYEKLIRRAVDKGFDEALGILRGLNVLTSEVQQGIDRTYELIDQKLDAFFSQAHQDAVTQAMPAP